MLVPDPKAVRQLLTLYATLRIAQAERYSPDAARELEAVCDTLCVTMGASGVHEAIVLADALLDQARTPGADGEDGLSLAV
ncbi:MULTISPECIES: DUF5133 domain-containing protein [Streptomyces]|uniref:DUF5133 domain-containing protein n=1 Tax=Streptomyces edwardsiae TaxID=3075527 RepID=A0ABU2QPU4_9ACTN|nr:MULTISPECIES: DUF5133 domain-containing protein [unclassified Streptomyces]MDT0406390.1 DUF5133 domain-containing protein [Streptomyces sp. DSM 41635]